MRFYETTIVLSPQAEDAAVEREIEKLTSTVARAEGKLVATQKWGVKRMAFPIQNHPQANYIHFVYQAPPAVPGELEAGFRINENILRHLTVLVEGPLPQDQSATPDPVPVSNAKIETPSEAPLEKSEDEASKD